MTKIFAILFALIGIWAASTGHIEASRFAMLHASVWSATSLVLAKLER